MLNPTRSAGQQPQRGRMLLEWSEAFGAAALMATGLLRIMGMPLRLLVRLAVEVIRRTFRY